MANYRIRPCDGNKQAWLLVRLHNGKESSSFGSYTTSMSLDRLLEQAPHLTPTPQDHVDFIPRRGKS